MKNIFYLYFIIITCLFTNSFCLCQNWNSKAETEEQRIVRNKIESVVITDMIVGDSTIIEYNKFGSIDKRINYDSYGRESSIEGFEYDSLGNCLEEYSYNNLLLRAVYGLSIAIAQQYSTIDSTTTFGDDSLTLSDIYELKFDRSISYKYNENGKKIESISYFLTPYTIDKKSIYKYDINERLCEVIRRWSDDRIDQITKFDTNSNVIEEIMYNSDASIDSKIVYLYDSLGNHIDEISYNQNGTIKERTLSKYDENGNEVESLTWNETDSGKIDSLRVADWQCFYKYDYDWKTIEETYYNVEIIDKKPIFTLESKLLRKYDKDLNIIEEVEYDEDSKIVSKKIYNYKFYK
jgi:hypothetical protein